MREEHKWLRNFANGNGVRIVKSSLIHGFALIILFFSLSCRSKSNQSYTGKELFKWLEKDSTGISFENKINTSDTLNIFTYEYLYNGGGVGVGDFNNDGKPDLFFVGSQVPSELYLNKGNFKFENITGIAGINTGGDGWPTGVSVIDINQDGLLDIFVCMSGPGNKNIYHPKLFVNQGLDKNGIPHFKEMAKEYGLDQPAQSIQAVFFDYDHDGDLDLYLLVGGGFEQSPIIPHPIRKDGSARNTDRLYRNDYDPKLGHPVFTDVSKQAGILDEGFGLGVSVLDINQDGWPDILVTDDYLSNDLLYVNNKNGTFSEKSAQYFKHTSYYAMGNDIGDINNDGLTDIISVDMLPEDRPDRLSMLGPNQFDKFNYSVGQGYAYQYMRNTLQLNRGNGHFSEIGQLAGIYRTSWSWSPLFADLDNDGYQDLFITNGFGKNITDLDFAKFRSNVNLTENIKKQIHILVDSLSVRPPIKTHNYAYHNNGDLTFTDMSSKWGFVTPTISNGAVYVDLDGDGALDLVTNNIDEPARVYRNTLYTNQTGKANNYLRVKLSGPRLNSSGIGSTINIKYDGKIQTRFLSVVRGFESSVESVAHFGMGKYKMVDTLEVHWPDGRVSLLTNLKTNDVITVDYGTSKPAVIAPILSNSKPYIKPLSPASLGISYKNKNNSFDDYDYERLIPKRYSHNGQGIAVGDLNGDGLEDFVVGGNFQQPAEIYLQNRDGSYTGHKLSKYNDGCQDTGMLLFDADGDGDLDLLILSGGNEFTAENERYQPRLYKNDGKGHFTLDKAALPKLIGSNACVIAADYDGDGDLDLFIGGRIVPGKYPSTPNSYILRNDGGKFTDVTESIAPALRKVGMVTSALWTDIDNDGKLDLIVVGEWMPITVFRYDGEMFTDLTATDGLSNTDGLWQSIVAGDFNNDGKTDYIIGNWGTNIPYKCSPNTPMTIKFKDFDGNGSIDPIISCYENGINYPIAPWDYMVDQMPSLRKRVNSYSKYSHMTTSELLSGFNISGMKTLKCKTFNSVYLENLGNGQFKIKNLPIQAQFAPLFGMVSEDVNNDGNLDLVGVANFYDTDVIAGREDASKGLVLIGDGKGGFRNAELNESGFLSDKNPKALSKTENKRFGTLLLCTQVADSLAVYSVNISKNEKNIAPRKNEVYAILHFKNGAMRKVDLSFGTSYLSESSRCIEISKDISSIDLFSGKGVLTRVVKF